MQFRSAAESDKDSAGAHWGMARAYENLGLFNETLEELRKTVELDSGNLEAKARLGNYFLLVQPPMIAEVEKIRDELLATDASFIEGHILTASIMAAQGQPDAQVVRAIDNAIALNPQRIESYISLERLYMTRERIPEAEQAIKRGIAAVPTAIAGYIEYGRFLSYASRDADAEAQFLKAVSINSANIEAREAIAEFYATTRQMEKAESSYLELVKIQENSPESRLVLAKFYTGAGREDEAIDTLRQILADSPEYVLARYRIGEIYLDRGDTALVEEQLTALFEINDQDVEALMLRARLLMQQGKASDAIKDVEDILKKKPSSFDALFLMAQARLSLGETDQANTFIADLERYHPTNLKTGLLKIQEAFTAGEPADALKLSNDLLARVHISQQNSVHSTGDLQDIHLRSLSSRGLSFLQLGKLANARADLQEVAWQNPRSASAVVNLAKVDLAERNYEAALGLYEKAVNNDPRNFDAMSGVVNMTVRLGRSAKAHARVNEFINANIGRGDVQAALHYLKSSIFTAEKNIAAAETELMAAIALDRNYLPAYSAYGALLVSQGRTDDAVGQFKKIIEMAPAAQAYTMLGILEESRGNLNGAETAYRRAIEITSESPIAANNLAWLLAENGGNLDEALQLANAAVSQSQSVAVYHDTLGWVYLKKGLASPAVAHLRKAVALEEAAITRNGGVANPGYRVRLGMALAKSGDKASARRAVETSLRQLDFLSSRELDDAKEVLASL